MARKAPFPLSLVTLSLVCTAALAQEADGTLNLSPQTISAEGVRERADGPVDGYVATRSATGSKTDVPITEIPQSVSVVTAQRIRDQGALTVQDSLRYVSGVRGEAFGQDSRGDSAQVRGITPGIFQDGLRRTFGSYKTTRPDPFQLERIEVLKGPSSMLYGQSPVGGLVNLVTKRPQAERRNELQLQYGSFDRRQIALDSTGPLNEDGTLLYRMVAVKRESQTQVDHVDDDRLLLAPSITWLPTDNFEWTVMADYQKDESGTTSSFLPHRGTLYSAPFGRIPSNRFVSEPGFDEYDTKRKSVTSLITYRPDDIWTLRQNLRWDHSDVSYQTIYGWPPVLGADNRTVNRTYYISKPEVTTWTIDHQAQADFGHGAFQHSLLLGVDYQHVVTDEKSARGPATPLDLYAPVYGRFDPNGIRLTDSPQQRVAQKGIYVQDQIKLDEHWLLTLGLRKDWATTSIESTRTQEDAQTTKRVALTYLFDNGVAPYLSYSESFAPIIGLNAITREAYKPLEGKQWEAGIKYQPTGTQDLYTAAIFDSREKNRQVADTAISQTQIGESRVRGLELEAQFAMTDAWDVIGTYTYLDSEILKDTPAKQGNRIDGVPQHMASVWNLYRLSIAGIPGFRIGAGARYVGASYSEPVKTDSSMLYDAMVGYRMNDWDFTVTGTNLADETYYTTCLARGDCFTGNRRTIVGTVSYAF
ncbi:TonB-dependent siderophore receptor [Pseudomonas sp. Marseille-QA0892]